MLTLACFVCATSVAELPAGLEEAKRNRDVHSRAREYFSEQIPGEVLISVELLGAVNVPGVYHVPRSTDVARLITLAGGTRPDADLERILIKRRNQAQEESLRADLRAVAEDVGTQPPMLESGDLVLVQTREPFLSQDTVTALAIISSVLSVLTSAILVSRALR